MGFKNKQKDCVFYASRDWMPVKLLLIMKEYTRIARKSGNKTSSRVYYSLEGIADVFLEDLLEWSYSSQYENRRTLREGLGTVQGDFMAREKSYQYTTAIPFYVWVSQDLCSFIHY